MKYERLTTRNGGFCADCNGIGHCNEDCYKKKLYRHLAELEDKIESGKLVELPCDTVYEIIDIYNPKRAFVIPKSIIDLKIYEIQNLKKYGYFTTKSQAEARLKELQGEE